MSMKCYKWGGTMAEINCKWLMLKVACTRNTFTLPLWDEKYKSYCAKVATKFLVKLCYGWRKNNIHDGMISEACYTHDILNS